MIYIWITDNRNEQSNKRGDKAHLRIIAPLPSGANIAKTKSATGNTYASTTAIFTNTPLWTRLLLMGASCCPWGLFGSSLNALGRTAKGGQEAILHTSGFGGATLPDLQWGVVLGSLGWAWGRF